MKLAVLGDSYGLPRLKKSSDEIELYYEDVYPEKLRKMLVKAYPEEDILLLNCSKHANTSLGLLRGAANDVYFLQPEVVVIQLGMVDLWPAAGRNVPPPFADLAGKDPWVSKQEYQQNLERFLQFCFSLHTVQQVILLNIPKVSEGQYEKYPPSYERTQQYNEVVASYHKFSKVKVVDIYNLMDGLGKQGIGNDGIHPTIEASERIAQAIFDVIKTCHQQ